MSSFFLLDNKVCSALPTKFGSDGHPIAFSYVQNLSSSGGDSGTHWEYTGDNCCRVPEDNGDSWTFADANDAARGAYLYLEIIGEEVDGVVINDRLMAAKANQDRVLNPSTPIDVDEND